LEQPRAAAASARAGPGARRGLKQRPGQCWFIKKKAKKKSFNHENIKNNQNERGKNTIYTFTVLYIIEMLQRKIFYARGSDIMIGE
jgi:hypothetical protein